LQNSPSSTVPIISSYSYTLDGNGNRTNIIQNEPLTPLIPTANIDLTYNLTKNRLLSAGEVNFTYDDEGRLATKDGTTYSFDYEHRLKTVIASPSGEAISFVYDGGGNRLQATRNGVVTRYIYDARGNLLAEADSANTIQRYYIYGLGLLAMNDTATGQVYTYHYNGIGSTVAMTDQNKNMVNKYYYTAFGLLTNEEETIPQPFKYVAQYGIMYEPNGLYYMRARYYDAETGRFVSEDPIGFGGGDVNLYSYVGNNPINFIDPLGLTAGDTNASNTWVEAWEITNIPPQILLAVTISQLDSPALGLADLIAVAIAAEYIILEARKDSLFPRKGAPGSPERPLPIPGAPGHDYWETPQGQNQPPRPGREGWWIVGKIVHAISEMVDHFIQ